MKIFLWEISEYNFWLSRSLNKQNIEQGTRIWQEYSSTIFTSRISEFTLVFFGGVCVAHLFSFLCCLTMCLYILSSVLWYPLWFPHKNDVRFIFTSSCLFEGSCLIYFIIPSPTKLQRDLVMLPSVCPFVRPSFRNILVDTLESTSFNGFWPNLVHT